MDIQTRQTFKRESMVTVVSVDWRGRACKTSIHGGMRAAVFVLGVQAFEIMAIAAVGNNLITYVFNEMHFPLSTSANIVTNFIGTIFLLSLVGGFFSDSYLGSFWTMLIFGFVELSASIILLCSYYYNFLFKLPAYYQKLWKRESTQRNLFTRISNDIKDSSESRWNLFLPCDSAMSLQGFIFLSVQAHLPQLRPPKCNILAEGDHCFEAKGFRATIFFAALYLVALGSGGLKPNIICHGADQFRKDDPNQSKKLSTYFNSAYFSFCVGELIALTALVWVQTRSGMDAGFGTSAGAMALGLLCLIGGMVFYRNKPPQGSIFTPIARVFVAAITKRKQVCPSNYNMLHGSQNDAHRAIINGLDPSSCAPTLHHTNKFRFLDKACIKVEDGSNVKESPWRLCTVTQVEQVKIILSVIPIFACTIIFNTILAQLQTFSVQQGSSMDTGLTNNFKIPPASLQAIPYIMLIVLVPLYEIAFVPLARRFTGKDGGISPLQRIGIGLFIVTFSMVTAALVENKRRELAIRSNKIISVFWISPQFLIFGLSEMFTAVGLIEFFYKQSLAGMQSFLTAMTYCSYSFGFYLSSLLVSLVNKITSGTSRGGWLSDNDLNRDRLDLFYWLLASLSLLNFFNYLFWSRWYSKNSSQVPNPSNDSYVGEEEVNSFRSSKQADIENMLP